jgi:hypothetical protein
MVYLLECANPQPLGMQDERIQDSQISASSSLQGWPASHARLNWQATKCWITTFNPTDSWLQVSFGRFAKVVQMLTQGRWGSQHDHWVKSYYLSYGNDGVNFYEYAYRGTTKVSWALVSHSLVSGFPTGYCPIDKGSEVSTP